MDMEREIKFTPDEALAFLTKYAGPIVAGLDQGRKAAESRLAELTLNGREKYGPDDLDRLIKLARWNIKTRGEALSELVKMAPVKETPQLRELGEFIGRVFTPAESGSLLPDEDELHRRIFGEDDDDAADDL